MSPAPLPDAGNRPGDSSTSAERPRRADPVGRSGRAAALPPEKRRETIVSATLPLLMEHGLAVTTRQIAEAAGIAEGTIFRVFPGKEALIEAVVAQALDPAPVEDRLTGIDLDLPLDERLERAVAAMQERVTNVWRLVTIVGWLRPPDQPDDARRRALTDLRPLVRLLTPDLARLRHDPSFAARALRALAIAGCHPAMIAGEPLTPREVVALFLDGERRPGPPGDPDPGDAAPAPRDHAPAPSPPTRR